MFGCIIEGVRVSPDCLQSTRWSTTLSSNVNLPHAVNLRAHVVQIWSRFARNFAPMKPSNFTEWKASTSASPTRIPSGVASPVTTNHAAKGSVFVNLRNAGNLTCFYLRRAPVDPHRTGFRVHIFGYRLLGSFRVHIFGHRISALTLNP